MGMFGSLVFDTPTDIIVNYTGACIDFYEEPKSQIDSRRVKKSPRSCNELVGGARNRTYPISIACSESIPKPIPILESIPIPE